MKKFFKIIGGILGVIVILAAIFLGVMTAWEYRPHAVEALDVPEAMASGEVLSEGDAVSVLTFNTGYAGLSKDEDFFMDGGTKVAPESRELVENNVAGMAKIMQDQQADIYFLQEVDVNSKRSYHIDQTEVYSSELGLPGIFAYNFNAKIMPYPIPMIGHVESGLYTMTGYQINAADRIALPESFSWPIKTCNLKRCMMVSRIPVSGTDKELVLINFHLEAYDSGEGKIAQTKQLASLLEEEYAKGNYVIAGGDFNQTFEGIDKYPIWNEDDWVPGTLANADLPEHFAFAVSDNAPTCRLLNGPYSGNYQDSQVFVIDGFIVSDNLNVEQVENVDVGFEYSDHQPVRLEVKLQK